MAAEENNGSSEPATDLEQKIIRQVEYYFGDQNVARDKFLRGKMEEDSGWVTLECLVTFNRLKTLSPDIDVIKTALTKSKSGLLELNSDDNKLRRTADRPIPNMQDPEFRHESKLRTVYVKGFPVTFTIDDVEQFFADKGKTLFIKMRRTDDDEHSFKGSVFVEFETEEVAKAFAEMTDLKSGDNALTVLLRDDYYKKKNENKKLLKQSGGEKDAAPKDEFKPGCVIHFVGIGEEASREDLKDLFRPHEDVAWVDFRRNETEGFVRFRNEGAAQRAIDAVKAANDGKMMIKGVESTVRVLEGDEETEFHKKSIEEMKNARDNKGNKMRRGGGGGGRGRGRGRGGRSGGQKWWQTRNQEGDKKNKTGDDTVTAVDDASAARGKHSHFDESASAEAEKVVTGVKRTAKDETPTQSEPKVAKVNED